MEAKELRIGNWVNGTSDFFKYPMPLKVQAITNSSVYYNLNNEILELDIDKHGECNLNEGSLYPIPLTPEILEKAGFDEYGRLKFRDDRFLYWHDEADFLVEGKYLNILFDIKNITYLHQLQNLYFALTGEELNIQL